VVRLVPIALACFAALHLLYLVRIAAGFEVDLPTRQQSAAVVWIAKEFGLGGVLLFAVIDVLVIIGCVRSAREKK
jgi:hypothetical protein